MTIGRQVAQYSQARLARRLTRSIPLLGAVIAVVAVGAAIRRKGFARGVVDTALDATPGVGAAKNIYEMARGDIIPDRVPRPRQA